MRVCGCCLDVFVGMEGALVVAMAVCRECFLA